MKGASSLIADILDAAHAKGLSQKALATRSGVSEETISRIKTRGSGNVAVVSKLAQAAGVSLGVVGMSSRPRRIQKGDTFREKYGVALAWSNKNAADEVLVRRALVKPRFQMLLDAALEFGVEKLSTEWNQLVAEGSSEAMKTRATTERMLRHIESGYRQATP